MGRLISTTTNYTFVTGTYTNSHSYDAASNRTSAGGPGFDLAVIISEVCAPSFARFAKAEV